MYRLIILAIFIVFSSCKSSKTLVENQGVEEFVFDTLVYSNAEFEEFEKEKIILPYNPSASRTYDILHTRLEVSFDWANQWVMGKADITLKPIFYNLTTVDLDAKGMEIHSVKSNGSDLKFTYDGMVLSIELPKALTKEEQIILSIDYTASPNSSEGYSGGAITSDKGLFFIDPLETDPYKPSQIWTQGETENNSRWFPTFDKPNERCSQEIYITVQDKYSTLSNGKLVSSTNNDNGTRTDYWKQDKPHAPYLFMLAVGEFAWVQDKWNNLPLHYIVEKEYKASAKDIFDHTPEMLTFFSDILNYPYPWDKYAQIVTRDYVSGAMENTSAVVFGEFVQKHSRELIDNDNDYIVAHEMFHHWFGDLVTCESWSNLTLNEGFANYSEYLWAEHKNGRMQADHHRMTEMEGYLGSGNFHPLIHFRYNDKEDMFDAHSYNKGGMVLHMLRDYVGDEAFFAALNKYLVDNQYTAVEVDELRMAFEDTVGEDLNWFFDQWYHMDGHPIINVKYDYNKSKSELSITTFQAGKTNFYMPFNVAIYDKTGGVDHREIWVENERDTFLIGNVINPATYVFDGHNTALAIITDDNKTAEEYLNQFKFSKLFHDKHTAFTSVDFESPKKIELVKLALKEEYYLFKEMAIEYLLQSGNYSVLSSTDAEVMAKNDTHSLVRLRALEYLSEIPDYDIQPLITEVLASEKAYPIIEYCIAFLSIQDYPTAEKYAKELMNEKTSLLNEGLAMVFSQSESDDYQAWFDDKISTTTIFDALPVYIGYSAYLLNFEPTKINDLMSDLKTNALNFSLTNYQRYFSTITIAQIKEVLLEANAQILAKEATNSINEIKDKETDPMIKSWYSQLK